MSDIRTPGADAFVAHAVAGGATAACADTFAAAARELTGDTVRLTLAQSDPRQTIATLQAGSVTFAVVPLSAFGPLHDAIVATTAPGAPASALSDRLLAELPSTLAPVLTRYGRAVPLAVADTGVQALAMRDGASESLEGGAIALANQPEPLVAATYQALGFEPAPEDAASIIAAPLDTAAADPRLKVAAAGFQVVPSLLVVSARRFGVMDPSVQTALRDAARAAFAPCVAGSLERAHAVKHPFDAASLTRAAEAWRAALEEAGTVGGRQLGQR